LQVKPENLLAKILCDSDLDYLGRADYHDLASKLRDELKNFGQEFEEKDWILFQLHFLESSHHYYTQSAIQIRGYYKKKRILELKKKLNFVELN
jgi:hypothetical protein